MTPLSPAALALRQQTTALFASGLLMAAILALVARRRLREEYAWLWLLASGVAVALGLRPSWLAALAHLLGAQVSASAAYFLGLLFLAGFNLHFCVKSSELTGQVRALAQQLALLEAEVGDQGDEAGPRAKPPPPPAEPGG